MSFHDRIAAVGMTRSGKSELLRVFFAQARVRRVLVDPKREWRVDGVPRHLLMASDLAGAESEVAAIDWRAPVVHVCPQWRNKPQHEALYAAIDRIPGDVLVWTDEAYSASSASWAPAGLLALQTTGAGRGHGHLIATQRPRNIARELLTEADHLFVFGPLDAEDLDAARRGFPFLGQREALELMGQLPDYGYLWLDRRAREVRVGDPLPEHYRTGGGVAKVDGR